MSAADLVQWQAKNNAWANATLHAAVAALSEQKYMAKYPSFFGSLPRLLNHIYEVDLYYIDALVRGGQGRRVYEREDILDRADLAAAQAASDARLLAHCADLIPVDLVANRETERADGMIVERQDHLLLHLFQHQVHHRGQAHAMLSQAGMAPPQLDDFYLRHGRVESAKPYWEG